MKIQDVLMEAVPVSAPAGVGRNYINIDKLGNRPCKITGYW